MLKLLDCPQTARGFGISHNPSNYMMNGVMEGGRETWRAETEKDRKTPTMSAFTDED